MSSLLPVSLLAATVLFSFFSSPVFPGRWFSQVPSLPPSLSSLPQMMPENEPPLSPPSSSSSSSLLLRAPPAGVCPHRKEGGGRGGRRGVADGGGRERRCFVLWRHELRNKREWRERERERAGVMQRGEKGKFWGRRRRSLRPSCTRGRHSRRLFPLQFMRET